MTTNERMNFYKYKHFQDKNGDYYNPFKYDLSMFVFFLIMFINI